MQAPLPLLIAGVTATTGLGIGSIAINTGALDNLGSFIEGTVTNVQTSFASGIELAGPTKTNELTAETPVETFVAAEIVVQDPNETVSDPNSGEVNNPVVDPTPVTPAEPKEHGTSGGSGAGQADNEDDDESEDHDSEDHEDHNSDDGGDHEDHEDED